MSRWGWGLVHETNTNEDTMVQWCILTISKRAKQKKIEDSEQQTQKVAKTNLLFGYLLGASEVPQRLVEYGGM